MFGNFAHIAALPTAPDGTRRKIPPSTPVTFPSSTPQSPEEVSPRVIPLVTLLQSIHRPTDIKLSHFEALGIHVIPDASPQDILPDASFLPPVDEWLAIPQEDLETANKASRKPLNNGRESPGVQIYLERRKELSLDNTAAFRAIRRVPAPTGTTAARLGNAYEFYKNLEVFSSYWIDTSLPKKEAPTPSTTENGKLTEHDDEFIPIDQQTHIRTGTGSQTPADCRQGLLTSFIKLVAYDFGCNVSMPRVEPRLHLYPPASTSAPPSQLSSALTMLYRTPTDRISARAGIVEGPLAALSSRSATTFTTQLDSDLDLAREIIAILLTAQQRAREGKTEVRFGEGKWWTTTPRWGGGKGGPIGKEIEMAENGTVIPSTDDPLSEIKAKIGGINSVPVPGSGPVIAAEESPRFPPSSRIKRRRADGVLSIYDNYRKMLPPASNWDRKARYMAIGKKRDSDDDVVLISCVNHHLGFVRARVGKKLLEVLEGGGGIGGAELGLGRTVLWRSRWFDMFLAKERVEAMDLLWGIMGWLMRDASKEVEGEGVGVEKMDVDK